MNIRKKLAAVLITALWLAMLSACAVFRTEPENDAPQKEYFEDTREEVKDIPQDEETKTPDKPQEDKPADGLREEKAPENEPSKEELPVMPEKSPVVPSDDELVVIRDYIPTMGVELKYATEDNFVGRVIYDFEEPLLRYGTVKKLIDAQNMLLKQGYSLKIWDAYRPVEAQFALWEICPDSKFVADPNGKGSSHSKGNTVDVTLTDLNGNEIRMPTGFDDFSALADRDYSDVSPEAAQNAQLLEEVMESRGFKGYSAEWWHFSDIEDYPAI